MGPCDRRSRLKPEERKALQTAFSCRICPLGAMSTHFGLGGAGLSASFPFSSQFPGFCVGGDFLRGFDGLRAPSLIRCFYLHECLPARPTGTVKGRFALQLPQEETNARAVTEQGARGVPWGTGRAPERAISRSQGQHRRPCGAAGMVRRGRDVDGRDWRKGAWMTRWHHLKAVPKSSRPHGASSGCTRTVRITQHWRQPGRRAVL